MNIRTSKRAAFLLSLLLLTGCGTQISIDTAESSETADTTVSSAITETTSQTVSLTQTEMETETVTLMTDTTASAAQSGSAGTRQTRVTQQTRSTGSTKQTETAVTTVTEAAKLPTENFYETIAAMTVEQKAAQMILCTCSDAGTAMKAVKAGVGGLCLFAKPFSGKTKEQIRAMNADFQKNALLPLIISVDEEGGSVNRISLNSRLRAAPFQTGKKLFAEGGWESVISDTKEKAELLLDLGVNVNLAPVCDVPLSSSNYIYNRCFSLDAEETAEYIRVVVTEMKADGLGATLKHFPGYGGSVDTHKNMSYDDRDYEAFSEGDFKPFEAGIRAGAGSVMVSHNIVNCMDSEYPASLSPAVHRILRETLNFSGVIITDDLGMDAIKQFTNGQNPVVTAVLAGNDLICYSDYAGSVSAIVSAVNDGTIREEQLDEAVMRVLKWKRALGII